MRIRSGFCNWTPDYRIAYSMLTTGYRVTKQWDEWQAVDAKEKRPQNDLTRAIAKGDMAQVRQFLTEESKQVERGELTVAVVAGHAVRFGQSELALDSLERSHQDHDCWLLFMNVDPRNDPSRPIPASRR